MASSGSCSKYCNVKSNAILNLIKSFENIILSTLYFKLQNISLNVNIIKTT